MRHFVLAVAAAFAFTALPAAALAQVHAEHNPEDIVQLPSDPQGAMEKARERVAGGDLEGAVRALQVYVEHHQGEIGPERLLGDLYFRKTDLQQAEATYKHILSYAPKDKETHNRLGSVYATENRLDEAIAEFNRSLPGTDSVPDLVRLHIRRGDLAAYKHELETVAADYPTSAEAQLEVGQLYETIEQPEVAERFFRRALDDEPNNTIALNGLGLSFMDEHRYSDAIRTFNQCLAREAYNYGCKDNLAAVYLHESQWSMADDLLQQAHALQPERAEALINMGYLADARGEWRKAVALYVQAATVYPYDPDAYANLGVTYNQHDMYQLAQAALIKGLAVAPEDGRLHFLLGETYSHEGKAELAATQYRAAALAANVDDWLKRAAEQRMTALLRPKSTIKP